MSFLHSNSAGDWRSRKIGQRKYSVHRTHDYVYRDHRVKKSLKNLFSWVMAFGLVFLILGGVGTLGVIAYVSRDLPAPGKLIARPIPESTKIYDREGKVILYDIHGEEKRTLINIDDLPPYVINASIAIEDKNFYTHGGIVVKSIIRALIKDIIAGGKVQGASTITQQFVKNALLTNEKSIIRKVKEIVLSYQIEKQYDKHQILEFYFNEIPYGSVVYGIESAAQTFFGKPARELTLGEAAALAAIPQRPSYFSPYGAHVNELFDRQKMILDLMEEQKYISPEEKERALAEKIEFRVKQQSILAPHFVMYVKGVLENDYYDNKFLEEGGLKIITSLDWKKQQIAEAAIAEQVKKNIEKYNANNASLISLNPKTGEILAMVGSADYFNDEIKGQVNVNLTKQQPGSSIKPIVYAAAFDKGYTPNTVLMDVVTNFKDVCGGDFIPKNYSLKENGPILMKKALGGSLNIPAVKTMYLAGIDNVFEWTRKLGYTTFTDRSAFCLAAVLGGNDVYPIEHARAYAAFANDGAQPELLSILRIEDKSGKVLFAAKPKTKRVVSQETVRLLNNVLTDNNNRAWVFGERSNLVLSRPAAAKTGTTNDNRDLWTIGYTPNLVTVVWAGNTDNSVTVKNADGVNVAGPIWNKYMSESLKDMPVENFTAPAAVEVDKPILKGETTGEVKIKVDKITGKLATDLTPPDRVEERTYRQYHSILHYINKDDPRAPAPTDPNTDQQYQYWEAAVAEWMKKNNFVNEEPPKEFDDIHTINNEPIVSIVSPTNNERITQQDFFVVISASAPRGIARAEYYLDDKLLQAVTAYPFNLNYTIRAITNGYHTLKVRALDDAGNYKDAAINLNFLLDYLKPTVSFVNISGAVSLSNKSFPYSFNLQLSNIAAINVLNVYYQSVNGGERGTVGSYNSFSGDSFSFSWSSSPGLGNYILWVEVADKKGNIINSEKIPVNVVE